MKIKYFLILLSLMTACQTKPLKVTDVVSADTIVLNDGRTIRYAGLEAPEQDHPWSKFCRDANRYLVQNKTVTIVEEATLQDDVVLAYVYTPILTKKETQYLFVNAEMVRFGFSKALPVAPNCRHPELWKSLWQLQQQEAKPLKKGIWSGKSPQQFTK